MDPVFYHFEEEASKIKQKRLNGFKAIFLIRNVASKCKKN
jgi:hypothetical protein